jgi:hypothetical protein
VLDWRGALDRERVLVAWEGMLMDEASDVNVRMTEDVVVGVNRVVEFDATMVEVKKVVRSEMVVREKLKDESVV